MRTGIKTLALYALKYAGVFHASRFLTRGALRIFCYHGICLIPLNEVGKLSDFGVDVQLHTHRHRLDLDSRDEVEREIEEDRVRLEPLMGRKLEHFCYPSGDHHSRAYPWLRELGLKSVTTTRAGFCYRTTPPFELPRIVDGEDVHPIEFEAELAGTLELTRRIRRWSRLA